jgi:hypothetical protein
MTKMLFTERLKGFGVKILGGIVNLIKDRGKNVKMARLI